MACLSLFYNSNVATFSPVSSPMSHHHTSGWLLFSLFFCLSSKVESISLFFRLYVACLSLFYNSNVATFSLVSYSMSIHLTSRWMVFLYFTGSTQRWRVSPCSLSYLWHVYLHFTILMWPLSLQHPTLCLFTILQSGYFYSILPYQTISRWFFSILWLICGKFFSIKLDGMAHVIFKLSCLLLLYFYQIIKGEQFFPVS